jgi:hypothetical protein
MHNNLHQQTPEYKTGNKNDCKKVGGLNKSARIINTHNQRAAVEEEFIRFALKIRRSDKQREERRNKRN